MEKGTAGIYHGVGRRKSSVARVWVRNGKGNITVNGKKFDSYFESTTQHDAVMAPLKTVSLEKKFDINVNVDGGGHVGQSGAVKLGIARALIEVDNKIGRAHV